MKKITLKFVDYDGYVYATVKHEVGTEFLGDIQVAPIVDIYETKRFSRWNQDIKSLTKDSIVAAVYETIYPFIFEEIEGKLYIVDTDYRCMNTCYVIPDEYAGKKVYGIMPEAFKNVSANACSIYIPKCVKDIKPHAFDSCYNTTLVFEATPKKSGIRKDICDFEPRVFFNCNEYNHFIEEDFEYLIKGGKAYIIRCLQCYGGTFIAEKVRFANKVYPIAGIDDYAFYAPCCSDFYEIYIPHKLSLDNLKPDYITNCDFMEY